jgi:hypothetical protein
METEAHLDALSVLKSSPKVNEKKGKNLNSHKAKKVEQAQYQDRQLQGGRVPLYGNPTSTHSPRDTIPHEPSCMSLVLSWGPALRQ